MQYTKLNLSEIPIEQAHGGTGSRQMLIKPEYLTTPHLEAITKGFIPIGNMFDWHNHIDTDEIFIVTQGQGKFYYRENDKENVFDYKSGNIMHKQEAKTTTEFFFIRVKAK
jgi:mannose-6-phosphate isomerase-like protein (cupin superfamily)